MADAFSIPDFSSIATQQYGLNQQAANAATTANRANQTNPNGSLTWTQDPATGQWTQTITQDPSQAGINQGIYGVQGQQLGQASTDLSNLGSWGSTNITGGVSAMPTVGGYSQQAIDAYQALAQPSLDKQAAAQRAALAAQGITLGSDASNTSEANIASAQRQSDNQAILTGLNQGNTEFTQGLQARQEGVNENVTQSNLMNALRGQQVSEAKALTPANYSSPTFASYASATAAPANNQYGAATDSWNAALQQYKNAVGQQNATTAAQTQNTATNLGLLGLGVNALGGASGVGSLLGNLGNWFSGGGSGAVNTGIDAAGTAAQQAASSAIDGGYFW